MVTMQTLTWLDAWYLSPEIALTAATLLLIILDLLLPRRANRDIIGWLAIVGLAAAAMFVVWLMLDLKAVGDADPTDPLAGVHALLGGTYRLDDFGALLKLVFLGATAFIILASLGGARRDEASSSVKGEMYYLLLPAALGAMVLASSADMVTLYVGLELLSITTYVLVGLRKRSGLSAEGAFKYLVSGGIGSAFILYGMSFLYGVTGETNLFAIGEGLDVAIMDYRALVYVAFFLMTAGLGVKLALAPFHAWAADVYQGAPTPVTSFLAVVSKGAVFAMLYRIFMNSVFQAQQDTWLRKDLYLGLAVVAGAAMIVGTAGALRQRNVKRLLALSGVANAGILLTPLALELTTLHASLFSEFIFYLLAYVVMNVGAFAVLTVVSRTGSGDGEVDETLTSFAGLYHRAPWTAVGMTVLLCSLAGLPITGGFFGKLFILFGTVQTGTYWLAAILLVTTIVSYAVYFAFIRQMYIRSGTEESAVSVPAPTGIAIWLCVAVTLALGFLPGPIVEWIDSVFSIPFDFMARLG